MSTVDAYRFYLGSDGVPRSLPPGEYRIYNGGITIDNVEQRIRAALYWVPSCDIHIEAEEIGRTIGFNLKGSSLMDALFGKPVNSTCTISTGGDSTVPVPSDDFFESMLAAYPSAVSV
jgi:hypothetical protein